MKKFNLIIKTIIGIVAVIFPLLIQAVTKEEMEQARTIAAKAYIRYVNDGSGYLDDLNPKTMEELESSLKPKEKENIKAFKAIAVPTDYRDWDKEKLVEYWAVTAFQNKGLQEKGRGGRIRARSQINKMKISSPAPSSPAQSAATESVKPETAGVGNKPGTGVENPDTVLQALKADEKTLEQQVSQNEEAEVNVHKATSYTWVYIMVLAILVAIVVALVVYASNVMKKNGSERGVYRRSEEDDERMEHLESAVADKNVEISMLNKKLESANRQNADLQGKLDALKAELAAMKSASAIREAPERKQEEPMQSKMPLRSIYLGRANSKGIFIRADRTLNVGNSVFVLETSDGYSGSFRVADSPAAWSLALSNPKEYLESACTGRDLEDTGEASRIVTESAGTAVFEGGCWRVIRKARIRYE